MTAHIIPKAVRLICSEIGCNNVQFKCGPLCRTHAAMKNGWKKCSIEGCDNHISAKGLCSKHAHRLKRNGDPIATAIAPTGAPMQWIKDHANYEGDDCIKWPFARSGGGYGVVAVGNMRHPASRIMCIAAHGEPNNERLNAAHECGNGHLGCMNPRHLSWKSAEENMRDARKHGTWVHGEKTAGVKLNRVQVLKIRSLQGKFSAAKLSRMFGVSKSQIHNIFSRRSWAWLK